MPAALVLPPFYYKGVSDDGIFAFLARLIERADPRRIKIYLYNFPAMTGLWYSVELIERLVAEFPGIVVGIKDSANDRDYQRELLQAASKIRGLPRNRRLYRGCEARRLRGLHLSERQRNVT